MAWVPQQEAWASVDTRQRPTTRGVRMSKPSTANSTASSSACLLLLLGSSACATAQAVADAPVEFWVTLEKLVIAVLEDIESLLWLFGI
mgnify:CR=1 FL=1